MSGWFGVGLFSHDTQKKLQKLPKKSNEWDQLWTWTLMLCFPGFGEVKKTISVWTRKNNLEVIIGLFFSSKKDQTAERIKPFLKKPVFIHGFS